MNKFGISLDSAKEQLIIEHDEDDALIEGHLEAAVETVLNKIGLGGVVNLTRKFKTTSQSTRIGYPTQEIISVKKSNCDGGSCKWEDIATGEGEDTPYALIQVDDLYSCFEIAEEALSEMGGKPWEITYKIGLGKNPPAPLIQAALFLLTHFYENRSAVVVGQGVSAIELPLGVESLIAPYREIFVI